MFAEDTAQFLDVENGFAEIATITIAAETKPIECIYDEEQIVLETGFAPVVETQISILAKTSDINGLQYDDAVIVRGKTLRVLKVGQDDAGFTEIYLTK